MSTEEEANTKRVRCVGLFEDKIVKISVKDDEDGEN